MRKAIVIDKRDNVVTAIQDLEKNEEVDIEGGLKVKLKGDCPFGHKFAIKPIKKGGDIIKYGECIGKALDTIDVGQYVHIHNVESLRGRGDIAKQVK
jgi:altronate dehydratase small subunit